jgi:hypothetical protein
MGPCAVNALINQTILALSLLVSNAVDMQAFLNGFLTNVQNPAASPVWNSPRHRKTVLTCLMVKAIAKEKSEIREYLQETGVVDVELARSMYLSGATFCPDDSVGHAVAPHVAAEHTVVVRAVEYVPAPD